MRLYQERFLSASCGWLLSALIFAAMLGIFWYGFGTVSVANRSEGKEVLLSSLQRAAASCYAAEGHYPPNVEYLEEHYGIAVNHEQYVVQYELAGSDIMPSIAVFEKGVTSEADYE